MASPRIRIVGAYAGETGDVVVEGICPPPCKTMDEYRTWFKNNDSLRKVLMYEPRGRPTMFVNVVLPPPISSEKADYGLIIMESSCKEYPKLSGSNVMCVVTVLRETGRIPQGSPEDPDDPKSLYKQAVKIATAARSRPITAYAHCDRYGRCVGASFDNVPSYFHKRYDGVELPDPNPDPDNTPNTVKVSVDVAYGGLVCAFVDTRAVLHRSLQKEDAVKLAKQGKVWRDKINQIVDPEKQVDIVIVYDDEDHPDINDKISASTMMTILPSQVIDRGPCGTCTSARMAVLEKYGQLGHSFENRHILDPKNNKFIGTITEGSPSVDGGIYTTIRGRAYITGYREVVVDPEDPNPEGFRLNDIWPDAGDPCQD
ncbi:proline racemase family [Aspergillus alliaceus]|uniref:proline racemase family n=1 Tax=Petromyces alliaceus TaxID=209559 RepID=UPI0012A778EA|nr:proline racemase family [Aspergillus alliaceus]KAB8229923.1 proline racemase family [Aspergillus alliaceus]